MWVKLTGCLLLVVVANALYSRARFPGPYCETRRPEQCCPGRDDECTVPIRDSLCYCDIWCAQHSVEDCCPDFIDVCVGRNKSEAAVDNRCRNNGVTYNQGDTVKVQCNDCRCVKSASSSTNQVVLEWSCGTEVCINDIDLINTINSNSGRYGWTASAYPKFDGLSVREGTKYFLGTINPKTEVVRLSPLKVRSDEQFGQNFNSRDKWPGYIHPAMDQGRCASSWAFSTAGVAADRWSIQSKGKFLDQMSVQNLVSCSRTAGCNGGRVEDAWWFMRRDGAVEEKCYPYTSGETELKGTCQEEITCPSGELAHVHRTTPPYRIANDEREIMKEIESQGSVQAIIQVRPDFFLYERGVYSYTSAEKQKLSGTHSVRIIGWGEDAEKGKYWEAVNSWGRRWGEDGMFKIKRGENESGIEEFVVGVWAQVEKHEIQDVLRSRKHRHRH